MNRSVIDPAFTGLIKQLVYLDENSTMLLDKFYPKFNRERKEIEELMNNYSERLEQIVRNFKSDILQSVVLIGSRVTALNVLDGLNETYTIVLPQHSDIDPYMVSYYSPIGRQLLLNQLGETITVTTPASTYDLTICKIEFLIY